MHGLLIYGTFVDLGIVSGINAGKSDTITLSGAGISMSIFQVYI